MKHSSNPARFMTKYPVHITQMDGWTLRNLESGPERMTRLRLRYNTTTADVLWYQDADDRSTPNPDTILIGLAERADTNPLLHMLFGRRYTTIMAEVRERDLERVERERVRVAEGRGTA